MTYEKIIQMLSEESDKLKETHPRVRMGIIRAIMIIEEQREKKLTDSELIMLDNILYWDTTPIEYIHLIMDILGRNNYKTKFEIEED